MDLAYVSAGLSAGHGCNAASATPGVRLGLSDDAIGWHRGLGISGFGERQRQGTDGDLGGDT